MVVKVVGQDASTVKRVTCSKCGAVNEYHPIDVRNFYTGKDYTGGSDGRDGIICGQCSSEITTRSW